MFKLLVVLVCTIFVILCSFCLAEEEIIFKENIEYNFSMGKGVNTEWTGYVKVLGYKKLGNNTYIYCKPITKWSDDVKEVFVPIDKIALIVTREPVNLDALSADQLMNYAWKMFDKDKMYSEAKNGYEKFLERFPQSEDADDVQLMIGNCWYWLIEDEKDIENMIKAHEDLIKNYPNSPRLADAYLYLGQVWQGLVNVKSKKYTDLDKAINYYEKALAEKSPRKWIDAQALGRIGQCLEQQGKKEEAKKKYKEVIEKYPDEPWAKEAKQLLDRIELN